MRTTIAAAADVLAGVADPDRLLTDSERSRAARFRRPADRDDYVAARLLARTLVAEHAGVGPDAVRFAQVCATCGGPHGRPRVVGLHVHVGWSRSSGVVAVVVADTPCAIDVESLAPLRVRDVPLAALHPAERAWLAHQPDRHAAFARLWVRKEVLVKLGVLTLDDLADVDVTPSFEGATVLGHLLHGLDPGPHDAVVAWG